MNNLENLWVVEYSQSQSCYHISTLSESIVNNYQAFMRGHKPDYVILGFASSQDSAHELQETIETRRIMLEIDRAA